MFNVIFIMAKRAHLFSMAISKKLKVYIHHEREQSKQLCNNELNIFMKNSVYQNNCISSEFWLLSTFALSASKLFTDNSDIQIYSCFYPGYKIKPR